MAVAGRFGELEGHMHGYDPALILRGIAQTIADGRLTYLAIPDEAAHAIPVELERSPVDAVLTEVAGDRCMVPWRDEARQFTYYCLLDAGHDTEPWFRPGTQLADTVEYVPEHGWYRLLDAYQRGAEAMDQAAARIAERAAAARTQSPR